MLTPLDAQPEPDNILRIKAELQSKWSMQLGLLSDVSLQEKQVIQRENPTNDPVDFNKARQLFERRQRGEALTSNERIYLERALTWKLGKLLKIG